MKRGSGSGSPGRECFLYLGHNATAVTLTAAGHLRVLEEEKLIRQPGGEYVPLRILMSLARQRFDAIYVINFLGPVRYRALLRAFHRSDRALRRFLETTQLFEVHLNHHVCHAVNGVMYALRGLQQRAPVGPTDFHVVVSDGTGNDHEATTVYRTTLATGMPLDEALRGLKMIERVGGGYLSCGFAYARLVCNAATGFAVLKDEYKGLGYEPQIRDLLDSGELTRLDAIIARVARSFRTHRPNHVKRAFIDEMSYFLGAPTAPSMPLGAVETDVQATLGPIEIGENGDGKPFSLHELRHARALAIDSRRQHEHFGHGFSVRRFQRTVATSVPAPRFVQGLLDGRSLHERRVLCAYIANKFLKTYYDRLVEEHDIVNLVAAGGVHYNVSLNNYLLRRVSGFFCASPLAGDVVHAPTVAALRHPDLLPRILDLRVLSRRNPARQEIPSHPGITVYRRPSAFIAGVADAVARGEVVNIFKGRGELGPRALLNTSTLSLPTVEHKRRINQMNGRDDMMPMAPAMTVDDLSYFFHAEDYERVLSALEFMIVALDYRTTCNRDDYSGVMHPLGSGQGFTGRPQVVYPSDVVNYALLTEIRSKSRFRAVINTSFNVHGKATVLTLRHALADFDDQCRRSHSLGSRPPLLAIGAFDGDFDESPES